MKALGSKALAVLIKNELQLAALTPEVSEIMEMILVAASQGLPVSGILERRNLRWEMLASIFHANPDLFDLYCACNRAGEKKKLAILEDEAYRRAVEGVAKGVYYDGVRIDTERVYSDRLMEQQLRAADPAKYAERQKVEHTGVMLHLQINGIVRDKVEEATVVETSGEPKPVLDVPDAGEKTPSG